jgi:uncharacterized Tic20 family protein
MLFEGAFMSEEPIRPSGEQDRLSRLAAAGSPSGGVPHDPDADANDSEPIARQDNARDFSGDKPKRRPRAGTPFGMSPGDMPRSYSTFHVSDDERLWATIAHGSAWITLLGGIASIGAVLPLSVFVPLGIYFVFRRRSEYVAFHALQAFVIQLFGTVGALLLLFAGGIVWLIGLVVALLSMLVLIGFVLLPLWTLVGLALVIVVIAMPIVMVVYGTMAAVETYNAHDYRYPFIARWVDRQLAGGFLTAM